MRYLLRKFLGVFLLVLALLASCAHPDLTVGVPPEELITGNSPRPPAEPAEPVAPPSPAPATAIPSTGSTENGPEAGEVPTPSTTAAPDREPPPAETPVPPAPSPPPPDPILRQPPVPAAPVRVAGLTESTIKLGVIVDDKTGGVDDGRSTSAFLAVLAWAEALNADGGLAGRRVRVGLIDAGLFGHDEALRQVCEGDFFAVVGSDALFDDEGAEQLSSPECGLLDFPARANSSVRANLPNSFFSVPVPAGMVEVGTLRVMTERHPEAPSSTATIFVNFPTTVVAVEQILEAAMSMGYEVVYDPTVEFDADFSVHSEALEEIGAKMLIWAGDANRLADILDAAAAAEFSFEVACWSACHSAVFLDLLAGRLDAPGGPNSGPSLDPNLDVSVSFGGEILTWSPFLPPSEQAHGPELQAYRLWLEEVEPGSEPDLKGVAAWAAARLFEEAVLRSVHAGTPREDFDLLTAEAVTDAARGIGNWNGRGLHGVSHPGRGVPTPCGVVLAVSEDGWRRVHPVEPGTFDCSPENLFTLEATAMLGLGGEEPEVESVIEPEPPEEPSEDDEPSDG